jgi:peptidoglycan/LPS O-acetylase OafA/YrhL
VQLPEAADTGGGEEQLKPGSSEGRTGMRCARECPNGSSTLPRAGSSRIDSLDILRGFLALAVAVYHISIWSRIFEAGTRTNNAVAIFGNYGVEGFFIVSGFCFFHLYGKGEWGNRELRRFHIKRFFRIAPLYYLAVAGSLLLRPPFGLHPVGPGFSPRMLLENLSLTFGLFHPNHSLVLGGWSIGIEYVFYMAFPLLAWATRRRWVLYLGAALLLTAAWPWLFHRVQAAPNLGDMKFHAYVQIPNHAFLFLLGGVVADLRRRIPWRLGLPLFLASVGLLFLLALPRGPVFYDHFDVLAGMTRLRYVGICTLAVAVFALYDVPDHPLRIPFVFLGNASYSVYLLHPFAWFFVQKVLPKGLAAGWSFAAALLVTLALAGLVFRFIEKPAMGLGRRLAD